MLRVKIRIPEVGVQPEGGPGRCGKCGSGSWVRWGAPKRRVRDVREVREVEVRRWRCQASGGTVRVYPKGVGRKQPTERLQVVVAVLWGLGLSLRGVVWALKVLREAIIGGTTAWRDVRAVGEAVRRREPAGRVRVLGVDGTGVRYGGQTRGMVVAVEVETGRAIDVAFLDERDPKAVRRWLRPLVEAYGVEVWVSDDLGSYREVAQELGVGERACVLRPAPVGFAGAVGAAGGGRAGLAKGGLGGHGGRAEPGARRGSAAPGAVAADEAAPLAFGQEEPTRAAPTPSGPTEPTVA